VKPPAPVHVLVQAAKGVTLFADARDRRTMKALLHSHGVETFALGDRAYHLILRPREEGLSRILHDVNRRYSRACKSRRRVAGHVFGGRTTLFPLPGPFWRTRTEAAMAGLETPMDVWKARVAWLMEWATAHPSQEAPKTLAVAWAHRRGVPPRAIAEAMGYASGHSVSVLLDSVRKRAAREPGLRKLLENAP